MEFAQSSDDSPRPQDDEDAAAACGGGFSKSFDDQAEKLVLEAAEMGITISIKESQHALNKSNGSYQDAICQLTDYLASGSSQSLSQAPKYPSSGAASEEEDDKMNGRLKANVKGKFSRNSDVDGPSSYQCGGCGLETNSGKSLLEHALDECTDQESLNGSSTGVPALTTSDDYAGQEQHFRNPALAPNSGEVSAGEGNQDALLHVVNDARDEPSDWNILPDSMFSPITYACWLHSDTTIFHDFGHFIPATWALEDFVTFFWCTNFRLPAVRTTRDMRCLKGLKPGWVVLNVFKLYDGAIVELQPREPNLEEFIASISELYVASIDSNFVVRLELMKALIDSA